MVEHHYLRRIKWQAFVNLTFIEEISERRRIKMWFAFVRELAKSAPTPSRKLLWCLREEGGIPGDADLLAHFHSVIAGVPEQAICPAWCQHLDQIWEKIGGGMTCIEPYDQAQNGLSYILKCSPKKPDNRKDSAVFSHPCKLMLSNSVLAWLKRRS